MAEVRWSPGMTLDELEKQTILAALQHFGGNKTATANSLGITVRTIDNKLHRYDEEDRAREEREEADRAAREEFERRQRGVVVRNADGFDTIATVASQGPVTSEPLPQMKRKPSGRAVATRA